MGPSCAGAGRVTSSFSNFLNFSRWLAACLVMVSHVRQLLFVDYPQVAHPSAPLRLFYALTDCGAEAVVVFFVISGLLDGGLTLDAWQAGQRSLRRYAAARVARIYVVLLPALVAGACWDWLGWRLSGSPLYRGWAVLQLHSIAYPVVGHLDIGLFLQNLFMLQGLAGISTFGSNVTLWSLSFEWWCYLLFALLLLIRGPARTEWRLFAAVALVLAVVALPARFKAFALIWVAGLGVIPLTRRWAGLPGWLAGLVFLVIMQESLAAGMGAASAPATMILLQDLPLGLGFALRCVSLWRARPEAAPLAGFNRAMAAFSYSVYICHFPFLLFLASTPLPMLGLRIQQQPSLATAGAFLALNLLLLLYCYAFHLLFEKHSPRVRRWLEGAAA
jgi:peptidoglycan/LPS O-acetylase OafA/YrhL